MQKRPRKPGRFRTKGFKGLAVLIPIDNVAEAIAIAEGPWHE
jgi:hypothetical protein